MFDVIATNRNPIDRDMIVPTINVQMNPPQLIPDNENEAAIAPETFSENITAQIIVHITVNNPNADAYEKNAAIALGLVIDVEPILFMMMDFFISISV